MASAYLITQANTETNGTSGNDTIDFRTAGGVTIRGLGGNDLISADGNAVGDPATYSATDALIAGNEGNDTIALSGIQGNGYSVFGGAGTDVISASNVSAAAGFVQGGGGNDTLSFGAYVSDSNTIGLNAGDDSLVISGFAGNSAVIAGGAGADSITLSAMAADVGSTINGGGGADAITASAVSFQRTEVLGGAGDDELDLHVSGAVSTAIVNGGSSADTITLSALGAIDDSVVLGDTIGEDGTGADTITINSQGNVSGLSVQGAGGADSITYSGTTTVSALFGGNFGLDIIDIDSTIGTGNSINGGAGSDTISVSAFAATTSGYSQVNGGGGGDLITVSGTVAAENAVSASTINGGAGADTISIGGIVSGFTNTYATATESTIVSDDFDKISAGMVTSGDNIVVNATAIATPVAGTNNVLSVSGAQAGQTLIVSGGRNLATFSGNWSDTDAVSALDVNLAAGRIAAFTINNDNYLFVQGGAQGGGVADDLVIEVSATSGGVLASMNLSGATVNGNGIEIDF